MLSVSSDCPNSSLPAVSVIVPVFDGAVDLPELLAGLDRQSYPVEQLEVLIVDNNSNDSSRELVTEHCRQRPHFKLLSETEIQSSYAARNTGIRAAQGEILAFTDADCRPEPGWLSALVAPFVDPAVGLVAGEILAVASEGLLEQYAERQQVLSQRHTLAHPQGPYGQTANLAVRREALLEAGLFRPYLTTGGDADLCWRVQNSGQWRLEAAPEAVVRHRHRTTLSEFRKQWRRYGRSNRYLHSLHGIPLQREPTLQEYSYRTLRWLLKELPQASLKLLRGQAGVVDLLGTPIDLVGRQARAYGQKTAQLPDNAREIPSLALPPASDRQSTLRADPLSFSS
ncbi:glycosyltransferase family 2 protein [Leptolyngbya sp. FACHB-261]|uniref:glycosyltransferase n=1 Tax=Leptolyngbya sp. FACHB-261 TaxID=2692806 RepID=UPI001681CF02|nr:glycosyltransferase [Leptolyngbya sp. FACHB-261]MBD2104187.1 glycosyltransferase [Leptolyngbya sp. FACHB-261]